MKVADVVVGGVYAYQSRRSQADVASQPVKVLSVGKRYAHEKVSVRVAFQRYSHEEGYVAGLNPSDEGFFSERYNAYVQPQALLGLYSIVAEEQAEVRKARHEERVRVEEARRQKGLVKQDLVERGKAVGVQFRSGYNNDFSFFVSDAKKLVEFLEANNLVVE